MKKFTLSLAALCICGGMFAAPTALSVNLKDGTKATYALSDKPKVTFSGSDMLITAASASTTYALADVATFTFSEIAAVDDVISDSDVVYRYDGETFECEGHDIRVFNLSGAQLLEGRDSVSLESLAKGVYVVLAGKQAIKVVH